VKVARGIFGVFAGYGVMVLVLRFLGPGPVGTGMPYFVRSALWTVGAAMLGGFITAWIAGQRELPYASALGLIMIATSVIAMHNQGASRPGWYETSIAGCGPIAALLGAAVRMLLRVRRTS
jgi:hypothetical protein